MRHLSGNFIAVCITFYPHHHRCLQKHSFCSPPPPRHPHLAIKAMRKTLLWIRITQKCPSWTVQTKTDTYIYIYTSQCGLIFSKNCKVMGKKCNGKLVQMTVLPMKQWENPDTSNWRKLSPYLFLDKVMVYSQCYCSPVLYAEALIAFDALSAAGVAAESKDSDSNRQRGLWQETETNRGGERGQHSPQVAENQAQFTSQKAAVTIYKL